MAPAEIAEEGAKLSRFMAAQRVSFLHAPPSRWQALIDSGLRASRALGALSGGEELPPELADQILSRCRVLWNAYGAVETTVYSTVARVERSAPVTIGGPIANTRVYVVDNQNRPVPMGVSGDLLVAGMGVTAGYLHPEGAGDEAFMDDPFGPGSAYRTGDRARWVGAGVLQLTPPAERA